MVNNDPFKNFPAYNPGLISTDKQNPKTQNSFNKTLMIPPIVGGGIGGISVLFKRANEYKKVQLEVDTFEKKLEKDFLETKVCKDAKKGIMECEREIKKYQEDIDVIQKVFKSVNSGPKSPTLETKLKSNKVAISELESIEKEFEIALKQGYESFVENPVLQKMSELYGVAKNKLKKFAFIVIPAGISLGLLTSFVLHKQKNKEN